MKSNSQEAVLPTALNKLITAYTAGVRNCWRSGCDINRRYLNTLIGDRQRPSTTGANQTNGIFNYLENFSNYGQETAMLPWLALQASASALQANDATPEQSNISYYIKEDDGRCELNNTSGSPVLLPVRVSDAFQGKLIYAVSKPAGQAILDSRNLPFKVIDIGGGYTAFVIFVIKYEKGDLGVYNELGIGLYVRPAGQVYAGVPGLYILDLPVNSEFARAAGLIWGLPKSTQSLEFEANGNRASVSFSRLGSSSQLLEMTIPRGGTQSSPPTPYRVYSMKDGKASQFTMLESGEGEGSQVGGVGIKIKLGPSEKHRNDPLWKILHDFEVEAEEPMFYQWSEHLKVEFQTPMPVG